MDIPYTRIWIDHTEPRTWWVRGIFNRTDWIDMNYHRIPAMDSSGFLYRRHQRTLDTGLIPSLVV